MNATSRRSISYPDPARTDAPDIPLHIRDLADILDLDTPFYTGTDAGKPAAAGIVHGAWYWATDTSKLYFNTGSWTQIPLNGSPAFTGTPTAPNPAVTDVSQQLATTQFVRSIVPPAIMLPYAGSAAPSGWLLCDGAAVSRSTYAALYAVIGVTYGAGDGSTTFNLPNLKRRVPVGKDSASPFSTLGGAGGEESHTLDITEIPDHNHEMTQNSGNDVRYRTLQQGTGTSVTLISDVGGASGAANGTWADVFTDGAGGDPTTHATDPHNNIQPFLVSNYIIKA